jgi:hypothetical protein
MELNAFASLAVLQLPSQSRLLVSACCPDKDLVILISRLGGKDRMSLWKMQGSKKWEVDVSTEESSAEEIVGLAWSPNGKRDPFLLISVLYIVLQGRASQWLIIRHASHSTRSKMVKKNVSYR